MTVNYKNVAIVLTIVLFVSVALCFIGVQILCAQVGMLIGFVCQITILPMFE